MKKMKLFLPHHSLVFVLILFNFAFLSPQKTWSIQNEKGTVWDSEIEQANKYSQTLRRHNSPNTYTLTYTQLNAQINQMRTHYTRQGLRDYLDGLGINQNTVNELLNHVSQSGGWWIQNNNQKHQDLIASLDNVSAGIAQGLLNTPFSPVPAPLWPENGTCDSIKNSLQEILLISVSNYSIVTQSRHDKLHEISRIGHI